jgi:hypothetical protein
MRFADLERCRPIRDCGVGNLASRLASSSFSSREQAWRTKCGKSIVVGCWASDHPRPSIQTADGRGRTLPPYFEESHATTHRRLDLHSALLSSEAALTQSELCPDGAKDSLMRVVTLAITIEIARGWLCGALVPLFCFSWRWLGRPCRRRPAVLVADLRCRYRSPPRRKSFAQKELLSNAQTIGSLEQQYRIYSAELRRTIRRQESPGRKEGHLLDFRKTISERFPSVLAGRHPI